MLWRQLKLLLLALCCGGGLGYGDLDLVPQNQFANGNGGYDWVFQISIKKQAMLCLDVTGGLAQNGNTLEIWECNGLQNQLWFFSGNEIRYAGDPSKCIDAGGNMKAGNKLMLWDCNKAAQQKWGWDSHGGALFLSNSEVELGAASPDASLCMDVAGGSSNNGATVQLWGCNGLWEQKWNVMPGISIRISENPKLCFDLAGGSTANGTPLQIWECNGLQNQHFVFAGGKYEIQVASDTSKCVDAGNMKDGTELMIWDCNGYPQQKFGYDPKQGTIYLARSESDASKCLDLAGGSLNHGTRLQVWDCNGCWNQDMQLTGPATQSFEQDLSSEANSSETIRPLRMKATGSCPPEPGSGPSPTPPAPPGPQPGAADMMPACSNPGGNQYGWPKFDSAQDLQKNGPWSKYLQMVYGAVPTSGYPICTFDFYMLHDDLQKKAGINKKAGKKHSGMGSYFVIHQQFGGDIHLIYHGGQGKQVAFQSNKWVEGAHCRTGGESASAWYWYLPGSGIWLWSGNTKAYKKRQESWKEILGVTHCSDFQCGGKLFTTAKSKFGYDTMQYTEETHLDGPFMWIYTMGQGRYTCGAKQTYWRAGWAGSQKCDCDNSQTCQNCKGYFLMASSNASAPCYSEPTIV